MSLDYWYLVCDTKKEKEFWIDQLVLSGQQLNPLFDIDEDLEQKVAIRTSKLAQNLNNSRLAISKAAAILHDDDDDIEDDFESAAKRKGKRDISDSRNKGLAGGNISGMNKSKDKSAQ